MSKLWMREAQILVAGMEIRHPPMTLEFNIEFDDSPEPNLSELTIYNLSDDTIARIKKGANIILNAGYKDNVGTVLAGEVISAKTYWDGVGKITEIKAGDGVSAWLASSVSKTFKAGTKASQIIKDIVGGFGLEIGEIKLANNITYAEGKTCYGSLQQVLQQVVNDTGSKMHITNGVVMVRAPEAGTVTGFLLNSDTGLIGTPGVIEDGKADYQVECLLNHRITTDSLIQIQSKTANGNFRVKKGKHSGTEQSWITEMEVVAL